MRRDALRLMGQARRGLLTAALLATTLWCWSASPVSAEDDAPAQRWDGILPPPGSPEDGDDWYVTRVRDAVTLAPIEGARWTRTPERITPWRVRHDEILSASTSDADGIAYLPTTKGLWSGDCHWIVRAPGYASAHEYGTSPDAEILLERGVNVRGHVLDTLGRPVVGALLEYLGGCSHGTPLIRTRTAADGSFILKDVDERATGQLWVEGPGITADLFGLNHFDSLGTRGIQIVMPPGRRYTGQVLDLDGEPIAATVVRSYGGQRGPTTMCDAEGRFVIDGVDEDGVLIFYTPGDLLSADTERQTAEAFPGVPCRVVVSPSGIQGPDPDYRVRVHAVDAKGAHLEDVEYRLVHQSTGLGPWGVTAEGPDDDEAEYVPPGAYRVIPDGAFQHVTFAPGNVRTEEDGTAEVTVTTTAQPRLRILGVVSEDAELTLSVPGEHTTDATEGAGWQPYLPAKGLAVLRVQHDHRPALFYEVGEMVDGIRTVRVVPPPRRRLKLPEGATNIELRDGPLTVVGEATEGGFLSDATGTLVVHWEGDDERSREVTVDLPRDPSVVTDVTKLAPRMEAPWVRVTALKPGEPRPEDDEAWADVSPGTRLGFAEPGWRWLRLRAPKTPETLLRWGTCGLRLRLTDLGPALVMVDGEVYEPKGDVFELRGFEPGVVRVVVAQRDTVGGGTTFDMTLEADNVVEHTVVLEDD